ncbi:uncharacterized protein LOC143212000 isoform X4 [Lasioglossum baleicum]|uniref:uncharacterized protein LOC143212000 isoform X4 n=1 Tax=Lasioglossum baleicum TaxID=434251 RepID=UPI003FCD92E0
MVRTREERKFSGASLEGKKSLLLKQFVLPPFQKQAEVQRTSSRARSRTQFPSLRFSRDKGVTGTRIAGVDWIQYADTCSHAEGIPRIPRCRELQAGAAARLGSTTFRTRGTRERESGQKNKIRIRTINRED